MRPAIPFGTQFCMYSFELDNIVKLITGHDSLQVFSPSPRCLQHKKRNIAITSLKIYFNNTYLTSNLYKILTFPQFQTPPFYFITIAEVHQCVSFKQTQWKVVQFFKQIRVLIVWLKNRKSMRGFGQKLDFSDRSKTTEWEDPTKEFRTSVSRNIAVCLLFLGTLNQGNVAKCVSWKTFTWHAEEVHIEITFR